MNNKKIKEGSEKRVKQREVNKKKESNYQSTTNLAKRKKIISIVSIATIFTIVLAIYVLYVVTDINSKKRAKEETWQKETSQITDKENSSNNKTENSGSNQNANSETKPKALENDDKQTVYTDSEGKQVPIPKGYVASSVESENKVNTGLVIYEGTTAVTSSNVSTAQTSRNQYVWVPVPKPSEMYGTDSNRKKVGKVV